ncbi:hypothetical protein DFR59_102512 [Falsibacillus pallidus]|uniref:Uncharacterized protein n=1 Tax=Falsibacillus pallidus TaxID=493781 RepID=A0A370GQC7_9BACI|nr:hypothetical protein DFR59_102512 [Falsibacillus pallidus]
MILLERSKYGVFFFLYFNIVSREYFYFLLFGETRGM